MKRQNLRNEGIFAYTAPALDKVFFWLFLVFGAVLLFAGVIYFLVMLSGAVKLATNTERGAQLQTAAALIQAGAAVLGIMVVAILPRMMERIKERKQQSVLMRQILRTADSFFRSFDRAEAFWAKYENLAQQVKTQNSDAVAHNWPYLQDKFDQLAEKIIDDPDARHLVENLSEAAAKMNSGYERLDFQSGRTIHHMGPFKAAYESNLELVADARAISAKLKQAHPNLSPREPNSASEPPPSSSPHSSSA